MAFGVDVLIVQGEGSLILRLSARLRKQYLMFMITFTEQLLRLVLPPPLRTFSSAPLLSSGVLPLTFCV